MKTSRAPVSATYDRPLKIAQVAPLAESVPPQGYGGTERVVAFLCDELSTLGHEVTLFASGDSSTKASLVPCSKGSLRQDRTITDPWSLHVRMLEQVAKRQSEFDLIHFHTDYLGFPYARRLGTPSLTTMHGRLDAPGLHETYLEFDDVPLISISKAQRSPLPHAQWAGNIYHGLPQNLLNPSFAEGSYLGFLGRFTPEKRPDLAIQIAIRSGKRIKLAAKICEANLSYFNEVVEPLLAHPLVEYVGEIGGHTKERFLQGAEALLFPIDWPEPFGLVMIESMACGTPVIARPCGSVPEVMSDPRSGFVASTIDEAVAAVSRVSQLSREGVRSVFNEKFSSTTMAKAHVELYRKHLAKRQSSIVSSQEHKTQQASGQQEPTLAA